MGHIGLTPQAINAVGKIRVQGKTRDAGPRRSSPTRSRSRRPAPSAIVLELVPEQLAAAITERLRIPTIGIGAGAGCSGQVQVITDLLGLGDFIPRHARPYADLRDDDPRGGRGVSRPTSRRARSRAPEQTVRMDDAVLDEVLGRGAARPAAPAAAPSIAPRSAGIPLDRDL